jgi:hypothetical protein
VHPQTARIIILSKLSARRSLHFDMCWTCTYRPPSESFVKAQKSQDELNRYLWSSTDSAEIFLERAMSMNEQTSSLWSVEEAPRTGGCCTGPWFRKSYNQCRCESLVHLLTWLSSGGQDSSDSEELQLAIEAAIAMGGRLAELTFQSLAVDSEKEAQLPTTAPETRPRPHAVTVKTVLILETMGRHRMYPEEFEISPEAGPQSLWTLWMDRSWVSKRTGEVYETLHQSSDHYIFLGEDGKVVKWPLSAGQTIYVRPKPPKRPF